MIYAKARPKAWPMDIRPHFSLLTASKMQGTLGKALLGLKVVNEDGGRISIGQAFGRAFAYIISKLILYIGFIMGAFGEKKTLHDICRAAFFSLRRRP